MSIEPHSLFQIWRPDEVAECLDGVPDEIYRELWALVRHYEGTDPLVRDGSYCLATWWDELFPEDQAILNNLAAKQEASDEQRRRETDHG